jgi:preprotein translocase subunit SecD
MKNNLMPRVILIVAILMVCLILLIPTFLGYGSISMSELKAGEKAKKDFIDLGVAKLEPINLGLDLQGGMHVVLGVRSDKALADEMGHMAEMYRDLFGTEKIAFTKIDVNEKNQLELFFPTSADRERALSKIGKRDDYNISNVGSDGLRMSMTSKLITYLEKSAIRQAKETIERRIDEFNVREPQIYTQQDIYGVSQIVVRLPGVVDPERAKDLIGKTAILEFKLVERPEYVAPTEDKLMEQIGGVVPDGYMVTSGRVDAKFGQQFYLMKKMADVPGKFLTDARIGYDDAGLFAVDFSFNSEGAKLFANLTGSNINKLVAIVLDDVIMSAPRIKSRIAGQGQITGDFSHDEAQDLSIILRSGSLPVPVEIEEERTVGPTLGKDSIRKGGFSLLVGGIVVLIFMLLYYRVSGLIADLALVMNIILILGALAMFGATLTLPGIAGIVLTIGMAVDANVIIFERIREELRLGKTPRVAVESGYGKALWTILDANITTAVAAIVLFQFGTGPIKGFAVTLSIGIISSVFTALVVTRTIFDWIISRRGRMSKLSI